MFLSSLNKRALCSASNNKVSVSKRKQQGNMLMVVIFIIVVLGFLATNLVLVNWSDSDSNNRSIFGTQAWLLAHSSNEYVLSKMYPASDTRLTPVADVCTEIGVGAYNNFITNTIIDSSAIQCELIALECRDTGDLDGQTFYIINSQISCGSGAYEVQRNQEFWVRE